MFISAAFMLIIPALASAEDLMIWNFRNQMPKPAGVAQLTQAKITPEGLHIRTEQDGFVFWDKKPIEIDAEVISIRARAARPVEAMILWQDWNATGSDLLQMFIKIPASESIQSTDIDLSSYSQWNWTTERFAIGFPAGTEVIIEEISFRRFAITEKIVDAWKSFWTFDEFRPYSINFLWGPQIATNAVGRAKMFEELPPSSSSAAWIFYGVAIIAAIVAVAMRYLTKDATSGRRNGLVLFGTTVIVLWILFDLRMGLELLSYAKTDVQTYAIKEADDQELRTHGTFYAIADKILPYIQQYDKFALFTLPDSPFFANLRYMAYPSVIVREGDDTTGVPLYVVIEREDIKVNEAGHLVKGDTILSPPGKIMGKVSDFTFLFLVD